MCLVSTHTPFEKDVLMRASCTHCCLPSLPQELRQLLHEQSSASCAALDAERSAAALQAEESAAAAAESAQAAAAAALHAAEVRSALLEGQLDAVEQERDALQQQVRQIDRRWETGRGGHRTGWGGLNKQADSSTKSAVGSCMYTKSVALGCL